MNVDTIGENHSSSLIHHYYHQFGRLCQCYYYHYHYDTILNLDLQVI